MLIKQLVLQNFRVFRGEHVIELAPRKRQNNSNPRPIVLFGGLNGAGKTSILSAIRIALYGRLAFGSSTQQQEYVEELSALIHNGSTAGRDPSEASSSSALLITKVVMKLNSLLHVPGKKVKKISSRFRRWPTSE